MTTAEGSISVLQSSITLKVATSDFTTYKTTANTGIGAAQTLANLGVTNAAAAQTQATLGVNNAAISYQ